MGVTNKSLNIKSKETHQLAARVAKLAGESMTEAVTQSLRERLERLERDRGDREARIQRILQIGAECAAHLPKFDPNVDPTAFLYDDETGLPK